MAKSELDKKLPAGRLTSPFSSSAATRAAPPNTIGRHHNRLKDPPVAKSELDMKLPAGKFTSSVHLEENSLVSIRTNICSDGTISLLFKARDVRGSWIIPQTEVLVPAKSGKKIVSTLQLRNAVN